MWDLYVQNGNKFEPLHKGIAADNPIDIVHDEQKRIGRCIVAFQHGRSLPCMEFREKLRRFDSGQKQQENGDSRNIVIELYKKSRGRKNAN